MRVGEGLVPGGLGADIDDKRTFRHESLLSAETLADHLGEIAEALRGGRLELSDDRAEMTLEPRGLVRFELTGYQQAGEGGVTIALSWRPSENPGPTTLVITSGEDAD